MYPNKMGVDRKIIRTELLMQRLPIYHDKDDLDEALCIPPFIVPKMFNHLVEHKANIFEPKEMYRILKDKYSDGLILRAAAVSLYAIIRYMTNICNALGAVATLLTSPKWTESELVERVEDNLIFLYEQSIENGTIEPDTPLCTYALSISYTVRIGLERLADELRESMGEMFDEIGSSLRDALDPKCKTHEIDKGVIEELLEDYFDELEGGKREEERTGDKITDFIRFTPTK